MRFRGLKILLLAVTAAAVLFLLCGAVKTLGMDRWADFHVYRITSVNYSQALCMLLSPPKTRDFLSTRE